VFKIKHVAKEVGFSQEFHKYLIINSKKVGHLNLSTAGSKMPIISKSFPFFKSNDFRFNCCNIL